jgi:3-ketosteroid 9alpha-monooxygenase subunit A
MVERFEFEVDTTKANEYWQEEVAQNLAKKAADDAAGAAGADSDSPSVMTGT